MIDFQGSFLIFCVTCITLAMGSTAIAVLLGALAGSSAKISAGLLPVALLPQMMFIGYFVAPSFIPSWLRWIQYICPMTYSTRILLVEEFHDCSENPFELLFCDAVLKSVGADPDEIWWYYLILAAQFVVFRLLGLAVLQRSARKFY